MSVQQANNSFRELLINSGLLSEETLRPLLAQFPKHDTSIAAFSSHLVDRGFLTEWQAGKLLQGKHRGFFLGPYKLMRHLAKGGMSTLYVAEHVKTGEIRALKVLPPAKADESSYLPRFLRKARLAVELRHPNVIRVYDILSATDDATNVHFMSMELLQGSDLYEKVSAHGALPVRSAAEIIRQAAVGLEYAHGQGLIHRDVKPGNVFETLDGTVKILDLGLAGLVEDGLQENLTREYNERILGTADYLAPEQAVDSHRADARADIYALGATFYFILTGRPPFIEGTLAQRILAHQTKDPQNVRTIRSDVPEPLLDLLKRMLVKQRTKRIQTASEVVDVLADWLVANSADDRFDQPAVMLTNEAEFSSRRLQRIRPGRDGAEETPTDSIRAAETQAGPSIDAAEQTGSGTRYCEEFESFLESLDETNGVHSVMDSEFLRELRRSLSTLVSDVDAIETETNAEADAKESLNLRPESFQEILSRFFTRKTRLYLAVFGIIVLVIGGLIWAIA